MTDQELVQRALEMRKFSYAPILILQWARLSYARDGTVFTGCNVENAAYGSTLCAERTALVKAVSEGRTTGWTTLAIAGSGEDFCWPCGACRQMLYEFAPKLRCWRSISMASFSRQAYGTASHGIWTGIVKMKLRVVRA